MEWPEKVQPIVDALFEVGGVPEEPGWQSVLTFSILELAFGVTSSWDGIGQPNFSPGTSYQVATKLSLDEARVVQVRWAATNLVVHWAGWYPWSLKADEVGSDAATKLTKWYDAYWIMEEFEPLVGAGPLLTVEFAAEASGLSWLGPEEAAKAFTGVLDFPHECARYFFKRQTAQGEWNYFISPCYINPSRPLEFARWVLFESMDAKCPNWLGGDDGRLVGTAMEAIELLVEWFHGPKNAYTSCNSLACSHGNIADALKKGSCEPNGNQAWVHFYMDPSLPSWQVGQKTEMEFQSELFGQDDSLPPPGSYLHFATQKVGGCVLPRQIWTRGSESLLT